MPIDVATAWHDLGHRLHAYVARRVPAADAEDVVQSVMVKLLEHRDGIGAGSVRAWLFTVTRNAVAEYYRQHRPTIDLQSFGDVAAEADHADPIASLAECLDPMLRTLSESDAEILRKIDLDTTPQVALAASLGLPLSTLKSRVQRARAKLRVAFDRCCDFERGIACTSRCGDQDAPMRLMSADSRRSEG